MTIMVVGIRRTTYPAILPGKGSGMRQDRRSPPARPGASGGDDAPNRAPFAHVPVDPENERRVVLMAARWERLAAAYPHPDAIPMTLTIMDDLPDPLPPPIPMPVEEVPEDELCCHPGCVRRAKSRGSLCAGHLWRQRNGRDMDAPFSVPESGRGKLRMREATDTCRRCLTVAWRVRADGYLECGECDRRRGRRKA